MRVRVVPVVRVATVLALLAAVASACQVSPTADRREPVTLTVSAASDLTPAFRELGQAYEQETGNKLVFNFGSTGQLAQQIDKGAPVDLFAAADVSYLDALDEQGLLVAGTKQVYAQGRITVWTGAGSPLRVERLEELIDPRIRHIAIANPDHAPYGVAARQAMQSAGVWEPLRDKLVLAENAAQTLQYAQTGNVDAAIVPLSLSIQNGGRWTLIPGDAHKPIIQALAVIAGTKHETEAREFAGYITGPRARPIMRKYGFVLPGEEPTE